jgi:PIN domain nuclease of toxin-antitoxin system
MKSLLLDTHVVLWALQGSSRLSAHMRDCLTNDDITIFVSPVSAYEIIFKTNLGKLPPLPRSFAALVDEAGFTILPVNYGHFEFASRLPLVNRDPWDRILTAQSILDGIPLASCDRQIGVLGPEVVW